MALPLTGTRLTAAQQIAASARASAGYIQAPGLVLDQAAVAAWVWAQEPAVQRVLAEVARRSSGTSAFVEVTYPDGKLPCACGPQADNLDGVKTWDGDPAWCLRKDGPVTAPVARYNIQCSELAGLFWPDLYQLGKDMLAGYLAHPPAHDADPEVCALWTWRVLELCSVVGAASNISPRFFAAFLANPVSQDFVPRVRLQVVDYDRSTTTGGVGSVQARNAHTWYQQPVPGQAPFTADDATRALYGVAPPTTGTLPPPPAQVAALWAPPDPGVDASQWFGGRTLGSLGDGAFVPGRPPNGVSPWTGFATPGASMPARREWRNKWLDDALTPAYFKTLWSLVRRPSTGEGAISMTPEWVCQNSRTRAWMLGDMSPWRPGWFRWDGASAWPSDAMGGADAKTWIADMRGHDGYSQLSALFRAMGGRWHAPGWIFYKEWHGGQQAGIGDVPYQSEQLGPGVVPGAWFYMDAAYRWGAWFAAAPDYAGVVNAALYQYATNYLPNIATRYARAGAGVASPAEIDALATQVQRQFQVASQQMHTIRNTTLGLVTQLSAVLAGTGVGIVAAVLAQVIGRVADAFQDLADSEATAAATEAIYSPTIRVAANRQCAIDASAGTAALQQILPADAQAAAQANSAFQTFITQAQDHVAGAGLTPHQEAAPMSTGTKVALGAVALAAGAAIVLALRKR